MKEILAKWTDRGGILSEALKDMRRKKIFTDCLIIADGGKVPVHRVVLAAFSPYFKNFLNETTNSSTVVLAPGISYRSVNLLVDLMYNGELKVSMDEIGPLCTIATKFQIKGIKEILVSAQNQYRQEARRKRRLQHREGAGAIPAPAESHQAVDVAIVKQSPEAVTASRSTNYSVDHTQAESSIAEVGSLTTTAVLRDRSPSPLPALEVPSCAVGRGNADIESSSSSSDSFDRSLRSTVLLGSRRSDTDSSDVDRHSFIRSSVARMLVGIKNISKGVETQRCNGHKSPSPETLAGAYSASHPLSSASERSVSPETVCSNRVRFTARHGRTSTSPQNSFAHEEELTNTRTFADLEEQGSTTNEQVPVPTICANLQEWSRFESSTISKETAEPRSKKRRYNFIKHGRSRECGRTTSNIYGAELPGHTEEPL